MKKSLWLVFLFAVGSVTLSAQTSKGPRIVRTPETGAIHVPSQQAPDGLKKIFSNLGKPADAYYAGGGWYVSGPGNGSSVSIALPFTPKNNSHISQIQAAIHYLFGDNQINLSLYGDAGGVPGTLLAGPVTVTNLPFAGTCCVLAIANFSPVAVTGGTQYWLVADTPLTGTGSNFGGTWAFVPKSVPFASGYNGTWFANDANDLPAGGAFGSIP